jgi:ABC-type Mn2+/Zn2+ transport system ATPase subunit
MTELSGGQTRALLIADAAIICSTPIVLLDEVENAGIHRTRAIELLAPLPQDLRLRHARPAHRAVVRRRIVMQGGRDRRGSRQRTNRSATSPSKSAAGRCARLCAMSFGTAGVEEWH